MPLKNRKQAIAVGISKAEKAGIPYKESGPLIGEEIHRVKKGMKSGKMTKKKALNLLKKAKKDQGK